MTDPFNTSTERTDPASRELDRLGINITVPNANRLELPGGRTFTDAQAVEYEQLQGRAVRAAVERVLRQRNYERLPKMVQEDLMQRAIAKARRDVNARVRTSIVRGRPIPERMAGMGPLRRVEQAVLGARRQVTE